MKNLLALLYIVLHANNALSITLHQKDQLLIIEPETLAMTWKMGETTHPINQGGLLVNGQPQTAKTIETTKTSAQWLLMPSNIKVNIQFDQQANISFLYKGQTPKRNQPITLTWFNLDESHTQTLFLPFNEGMRVPTDNKIWGKYLSEAHPGSNTTQDLKMPFWTFQQNNAYFTFLLIEATNNQLNFIASQPRLDMSALHQFTKLNHQQSFKIKISTGKDALSGARDYRQWRQEKKLTSPLNGSSKPQFNKLIGATHVYLFGEGLISTMDVNNWEGLNRWYLKTFASTGSINDELASVNHEKNAFNHYLKQLLVDQINQQVAKKFPTPRPTLKNNSISAQYQSAQNQKNWLQKEAGQYLTPESQWGQALSSETLKHLKQAGITKLWLGLSQWTPAFYQPQVVDQAKNQGYLIGTYDSYNTAIPPGINDHWLTAQLPAIIREQCAIVKADGHKKSGFRGHGYYLNPTCHLEYVLQRASDVVKFGRFNSLFLDVDATAMGREDYGRGTTESDMLKAFNKRMLAISKQVLLGSEDANALTTQGVTFAHGMETVGFGWTDKEMTTNRDSPYFLGQWYPDHRPEYFFKSAEVKEPYKTLLFSPIYRIPLYQAVFHDEVINSHHWHNDSLKFSNVQTERDLTSMLYNTPAMVHLSRSDANKVDSYRIKAIKHYQDGFMPIHEWLWNKALTQHQWLDNSGLIQQTTFNDGSRIIANFSPKEKALPNKTFIEAETIIAYLSNGKVIKWKSQ